MNKRNLVPFNDLRTHFSPLKEKIISGFSEVIASGSFILGESVQKFEEDFAEYHSVKHSVGVANGTEAIQLSLAALGLTDGHKVATAANAGMFGSIAIFSVNSIPVYLEVSAETNSITLDQVKQAISFGVDAVLVTHLYGLANPEIHEIAELCQQNLIPLIEDCSQAHGAKVSGKLVGTFGDVSAFSFYPVKNLGALGDGGIVITNSDEVSSNLRKLRQYGWSSRNNADINHGKNSRLDELQAKTLSIFLPELNGWNDRRREIANRYIDSISNPNIAMPKHLNDSHVAHLFVIRCAKRELLQKHLANSGIQTEIHYPIPDHLQKISKNRIQIMNSLTLTEKLSQEVLSLPCFPSMTEEQINLVIEAVNSWKI